MKLPSWPYLAKIQRDQLLRAAFKYFPRRHEDREDFLQSAYTLMWEYWQKSRFEVFGVDSLLQGLQVKWIQKWARQLVQRRGIQEILFKDGEEFEPDQTLGEALDFCVAPNPNDAISERYHRFILDNGMVVRLHLRDLADLLDYKSIHSIYGLKYRKSPLKAWLYRGKFYKSRVGIARKFNLSAEEAEANTTKITLRWVDAN